MKLTSSSCETDYVAVATECADEDEKLDTFEGKIVHRQKVHMRNPLLLWSLLLIMVLATLVFALDHAGAISFFSHRHHETWWRPRRRGHGHHAHVWPPVPPGPHGHGHHRHPFPPGPNPHDHHLLPPFHPGPNRHHFPHPPVPPCPCRPYPPGPQNKPHREIPPPPPPQPLHEQFDDWNDKNSIDNPTRPGEWDDSSTDKTVVHYGLRGTKQGISSSSSSDSGSWDDQRETKWEPAYGS